MALPEVFRLLVAFHYPELAVVPVLLHQLGAVRTIFLIVPRVVIAGLAIVVPLFLTPPVVSLGRHRGKEEGGAQ